MSEDKMREEFEKEHEHIYRQFDCRHSGNYTNSFIQAKWEAWKACAAIKDAEIAALQHLLSECRKLLTDEQNTRLSRDAVIKELREALLPFAENIPEDYKAPCHNGLTTARKCGRCGKAYRAYEALANSEHHNSRALEKMLLGSRIDELEISVDDSNTKFERLRNLKAKLAELNKE